MPAPIGLSAEIVPLLLMPPANVETAGDVDTRGDERTRRWRPP